MNSIFTRSTCVFKAENHLLRYRRDGSRFGPKLAPDGGRIFISSSRDLMKFKAKRQITDETMEKMHRSGKLVKFLQQPRDRKKIILEDKRTGWKKWESRRCGAVGVKIGMRRECDAWGNVIPVTLIQLRDNEIIQVKDYKDHQLASDSGYFTMQVGAGLKKWKNLHKAQQGHFAHKGLDPKAYLTEFKVSPNAVLPVGTKITVNHFVPGQFVDVKGISKGKGTQGVMKRFGYSGFPATHGVSISHRNAGAINSGCQTPGRVLKGTKMAGRMGGKVALTYNLQIIKINVEDGILAIKGGIPGAKGSWIRITDAVKKPHRIPPPFPTYQLPAKPGLKYKRMKLMDPYKDARLFDWEQRWKEASVALKSAQQSAGGLLEGEEDDGNDDFDFK